MSWSTVQKTRGPTVNDCTLSLRSNGRINLSLSTEFMAKAGFKAGDNILVQRGEGPDAGKARLMRGAGGYALFARKNGAWFAFTNWPDKPKDGQKAVPVEAAIVGVGTVEIRLPSWMMPQRFEDVKTGPRRVA